MILIDVDLWNAVKKEFECTFGGRSGIAWF
jgi:hypothetical protein